MPSPLPLLPVARIQFEIAYPWKFNEGNYRSAAQFHYTVLETLVGTLKTFIPSSLFYPHPFTVPYIDIEVDPQFFRTYRAALFTKKTSRVRKLIQRPTGIDVFAIRTTLPGTNIPRTVSIQQHWSWQQFPPKKIPEWIHRQ